MRVLLFLAVLMMQGVMNAQTVGQTVGNGVAGREPQLNFRVRGVSFTMVLVEGGTFTMGATSRQDADVEDDELPAHRVTLSDFFIGQTEVTQGLWKAVMGSDPSYFSISDDYPVENVSWEDCQTFIDSLNALTGNRFALPTEAQWEFAARGGNKSQHYKYAGSDNIGEVAWFNDNSRAYTHPVASKQPNELGLYDMSGNVYEWCIDRYEFYGKAPQTNPVGTAAGADNVRRGGSWGTGAEDCRVSNRSDYVPTRNYGGLGFRLVLLCN